MAAINFMLFHNYTKEKQIMVDSEIQQLVNLNQELKNS
ncbi:hypothetical protein CRD_02917 [Raphidiopsis brookii D9]|nr:hypothetical protein CRD_02917 [Raphidiopsis brookii D9]